ncbi:MAG: DUF4870 domain-containing protein [Anaerolineales bacterium]|nr:DUF4870 domain-containing protein [Anaerolineales bacterium]
MSNEPVSSMPNASQPPLSESDERQYAMFAHLGVLANLITGFLGPLVPLIIYMMYKDRSRYVAYQSLQALIFQLIWWVGGSVLAGVTWAVTGFFAAFIIGILCIPLACVFSAMPLIALGYGIYGGIQASQGQDFKYWLVGDWVRKTLTG